MRGLEIRVPLHSHRLRCEIDIKHELFRRVGNQSLALIDTVLIAPDHQYIVGTGLQQMMDPAQIQVATLWVIDKHLQINQLSPVKLFRFQRRQLTGGNRNIAADESCCLFAVLDTVEPHHQPLAMLATLGDGQRLPASVSLNPALAVAEKIFDGVGVRVHLQPTLHPIDRAETAYYYQLGGRDGHQADFCASLISDATRSESCAPLPTQWFRRSKSTRRRSSPPRAIGLKKPTRSRYLPLRGLRLSVTVR